MTAMSLPEVIEMLIGSNENKRDIIDAQAAELERLRAIVRDLAATNPIHDDDWGQVWCAVCSEPSPEHVPGCPWLRATQEAP